MKQLCSRPPFHYLILLIAIILSITIFVSRHCDAAELDNGSAYRVTYAQGTVFLTCQGFYNGQYIVLRRNLLCQDSFANPAAFARFTHAGSRATKVSLTNTSAGNISKTKDFSPERGESQNFNLLIRTLFQQPLLVPGNNLLSYKLLLPDNSVEQQGIFEVRVDTDQRYCPNWFMNSPNLNDCQYGSPFVCDEYFRQSRCL
jgi:hypothetical protein